MNAISGRGNAQILRDFRKVAKSHARTFTEAKDHVFDLLGRQQNAESGRFREELLRSFLAKLLPTAVSVDTGFIYGFEEVETSKQLDIIIWHRAAHAPVYDAGQFVIVPPESVIAVISVKNRMTPLKLRHGLDNLLSVAFLDAKFRRSILTRNQKRMPAIAKFLVFYSQPQCTKNILPTIQEFYADVLAKQSELVRVIVPPLQRIEPLELDYENWEEVRRVYPRLITTIEEGPANYTQGWGPPDDTFGQGTYGPNLRRLPFIYRHETKITTGFEKLMFRLLEAVFHTLESPGLSLLSAWGDLNPATGFRSSDAEETVETEGVPLLNPENLARFEEGDG